MSEVVEIDGYPYRPYNKATYSIQETLEKTQEFYQWLDGRRTVRDISDKPLSRKIIENIIMAASTAPSGAHKQPWTFCVVSDVATKKKIRKAAEKEEYESYHGRMSDRWLKDLEPIGTNWEKPFLEKAPFLIIVFKRVYEVINGKKANNYYVNESVGIACGMLISAIHHAGLVTLTHTPSPMNFLANILQRPSNERPYLLLPIGYPKENALVPDLKRKGLSEISVFYS